MAVLSPVVLVMSSWFEVCERDKAADGGALEASFLLTSTRHVVRATVTITTEMAATLVQDERRLILELKHMHIHLQLHVYRERDNATL